MSFSKAADKLAISQGAVSKQILALEAQLGQALFTRQINGIELTAAGKRYLPEVTHALQIIQFSTAHLLQSNLDQEQLDIDVTPSFASLWMIKNLDRYLDQCPNTRVNLRTGDDAVKFDGTETDITIRCRPISDHYEYSTLLCKETLMLVGSTQLLKQKPITQHHHLVSHRFIPHLTRPELWQQFKVDNHLEIDFHYHAIGYEHYYMSLSAVLNGSGLALIPDFMATNMLQQGCITNPLGLKLESRYGYYISVPHYKRDVRFVADMHDWLLERFSS